MADKTLAVTRHDLKQAELDALNLAQTGSGGTLTDEEIVTGLVDIGWDEVIARRVVAKLARSSRLHMITTNIP